MQDRSPAALVNALRAVPTRRMPHCSPSMRGVKPRCEISTTRVLKTPIFTCVKPVGRRETLSASREEPPRMHNALLPALDWEALSLRNATHGGRDTIPGPDAYSAFSRRAGHMENLHTKSGKSRCTQSRRRLRLGHSAPLSAMSTELPTHRTSTTV